MSDCQEACAQVYTPTKRIKSNVKWYYLWRMENISLAVLVGETQAHLVSQHAQQHLKLCAAGVVDNESCGAVLQGPGHTLVVRHLIVLPADRGSHGGPRSAQRKHVCGEKRHQIGEVLSRVLLERWNVLDANLCLWERVSASMLGIPGMCALYPQVRTGRGRGSCRSRSSRKACIKQVAARAVGSPSVVVLVARGGLSDCLQECCRCMGSSKWVDWGGVAALAMY